MNLQQYQDSIGGEAPPAGLTLALQALWWAGKGEWDRAHGCAQQQEGDPACDWVHAHLHRLEGDLNNAAYWYRRAGHAMPADTTAAEWPVIASALLARS